MGKVYIIPNFTFKGRGALSKVTLLVNGGARTRKKQFPFHFSGCLSI